MTRKVVILNVAKPDFREIKTYVKEPLKNNCNKKIAKLLQ